MRLKFSFETVKSQVQISKQVVDCSKLRDQQLKNLCHRIA